MTETEQPDPLSLAPERRQVTCVLGGRSGTSFVARLAGLLGIYLGPEEHMIAASRANKGGFWEHSGIVALNNEILNRYGARWPNLVPLPHGWENDPRLDDLRTRALQLIRDEFSDAPLWGWKDPRASATLPFWQALVPHMRYVLCFRNPLDTAHSHAETLAATLEHVPANVLAQVRQQAYCTALANWLEFVRSMLTQTSGRPRLILLYEDVMERTGSELRRIARFIGKVSAATNPDVLARVRSFKSDKLRHHNSSLSQVLAEPALPAVAKRAFLSLQARVALEQRRDSQRAVEDAGPLEFVNLAGLEETEAARRTVQERVRRIISEHTPPGAQVVVASHGDDGLLNATGRHAVHFPQNDRGEYLGHHPADSAEVITALRDVQARGATFLAIPQRQRWWLEHYIGLRDYLESRHLKVYDHEQCVVYSLQDVRPSQHSFEKELLHDAHI
jgi:hypothetical protein